MGTLRFTDDMVAPLVHLGYLAWDRNAGETFVPNREVLEVFRDSTAGPAW